METTATVIADRGAIANGTSIDVCVVADFSLAELWLSLEKPPNL